MPQSKVKYTRLRATADFQSRRKGRDEFEDEQFKDHVTIRPPVKSIALAIFLFSLGTLLLVLGSLMVAGVIGDHHESGRATPLLVAGAICFIPGLYQVRIAYFAWKGYHGFSYADIVGYDDD